MSSPTGPNTDRHRYHLTPTARPKGWQCLDRLTQAVGWGASPERAMLDAQIELEMMTDPDLHK